jgi:bacterioferritin-associated ferredoxin
MYVCLCKGITESDVRKLGRGGVLPPDLLAATLGIDEESCCGRCARNIQELVALAASETEALHLAAGSR